MMTKKPIRNFGRQIVGYVEEDDKGNKTIRNFGNQILGYYDARRDVTLNWARQIIARGDSAVALINIDLEKNNQQKLG